MRQTLDTDTTGGVDEQNRNVQNVFFSSYFVAWIYCRIWACVCDPFFPKGMEMAVSFAGTRQRSKICSSAWPNTKNTQTALQRPPLSFLAESFGARCRVLQRGLSFYQLVVETQTRVASWTCGRDLDLSGFNHLVISAMSDVTTCLWFPRQLSCDLGKSLWI